MDQQQTERRGQDAACMEASRHVPNDDTSRAWIPKSIDNTGRTEKDLFFFFFYLEQKLQTMFDFVEQNWVDILRKCLLCKSQN